jgi:hypothetical protein
MKCAKCNNPAKVADKCWWCFYDDPKEYRIRFGKDGVKDEKIPILRRKT